MNLWEEGVIKETTPLNIFDFSQIEASFRLVQSGKHIGKIVLTAGKDDLVQVSPPLHDPFSSRYSMTTRSYRNPKLRTSSRVMEQTSSLGGLGHLAEAWPVGWSHVGRVI
jgi:hypothetical protein